MDITALLATVVVVAVLITFFIIGWKKGFLKVILKAVSLLVTLIIAAFLLQPATDFLAENTKIEKQMETRLEKKLGFSTQSESGDMEKKDKEDEQETGYDVSQLEEIEKNLSEEERADVETEIIKGLSLPGLLKNSLIAKNNVEEYVKLGVESFKQYIVKSIAMLELKILTYIGLVIVIFVGIRLLLLVSKVIAKIPVIKGINKFAGGIVGLIEGLLFIWLVGLIVSLISQTEFGTGVVEVIHKSFVLDFFYEQNLLLKLAETMFGL